MNTNVCRTYKCECGGSYTKEHKKQHEQTNKHKKFILSDTKVTQVKTNIHSPEYIKLYRSMQRYNPYNIIHQKSEIIDNTFKELFDVRFRTCVLGGLMEFYDHYDDSVWKRKQELNDMHNREHLGRFLRNDIVGRVFEYKFN